MTPPPARPVRRPRPPRDQGVSAVLAYLKALEVYATALEQIIREVQQKEQG